MLNLDYSSNLYADVYAVINKHRSKDEKFLNANQSTLINDAGMLKIYQAATDVQLDQVRELMRSFVDWLRQRYYDSNRFIDGYFNQKAFEMELAALPGRYGPPEGRLLLALYNGQPAGSVALRKLGSKVSEMKRMFVNAEFHGQGIGRKLAQTLINEAKNAGYERMRLDTGDKQIEAQSLYRSLGFQETKPYYALPEDVKARLLFMELIL